MITTKQTWLLVLLLQVILLSAQEEDIKESKLPWLDFSGYIKDLQSIGFVKDETTLTLDLLLHNRLNIGIRFSNTFSAHIGMRNRIFFGDMVKNTPGFGDMLNNKNELIPLSFTWADKYAIAGHTTFDRAYLDYSGSKADLRLGRQRINWGVNTIWNPNDIFNAYNYLDFDYEERPGNDAIRLRLHPGSFTIEAAYKPGKRRDDHIGALLLKFNKRNYDFQFLGGTSSRDIVAGMGFAGSIVNAGLKGEISYFHPMDQFSDTSGTVSAAFMADYSTKKGWYLSGSFLLNINKYKEGIFSPALLGGDLTAKTLSPFRYNFYAGFMKQITPILTGGCSVMYATKYHTLIIYPTISYNVSESFDIDLIMQSWFANFPDRYRSQWNSIYLRMRYSFGN